MENKLYLQAKEVCEMLGVSRAFLSRIQVTNQRGFTDRVVRRIGKRRIVFDRDSLLKWIDEGNGGES